MNLINQLNPAFKSGRFDEEEDNMIHKYWSKFKQVCMIKMYFKLGVLSNLFCPYNL